MQSLLETEDVYGVYEFHSLPMEAEGVAIAPEVTELVRRFLGLAGYYRRFIKGYATLAAPLTDLLRKDGFKWEKNKDREFRQAFRKILKQRLSTAPVLGLPNFEKTFTVETEASADGIGAVLLQNNQPICYFSRKFGPRMRLAATYPKGIVRHCGSESKLKSLLLREFYNTPIAGQGGFKKLLESGGYLQPLPAPTAVWEDISMDFITGMPLSMGFPVVLVVVDRFTKYAHFATLPTSFNAHKVAKVFVETVVKHNGIPKTIVSDRDPIFVSKFWTQLSKLSELYGTYPPGSSKVAVVEDMLVERDELLRLLRENLLAAKNRMEEKANLKRRKVEFNVGDKVLIKLKPYRQLTLAKRLSHKLAKRSPEEATWEFVSKFQAAYPAYDLEDKVISEEEGNDTPGSLEAGRAKRVSVAPKWHKDFVIR
ncbi:ty3-gypsy retrotransposon protein [Tanacetum coccineum]